MNLDLEPSVSASNKELMQQKLDSYVRQAGIKDTARARQLITRHFQSYPQKYPYILFRSGTLYFFTVDGLSTAETLAGARGTEYLRFDGERITRLDPLYYLGPEAEKNAGAVPVYWDSGYSNNNNNNNNNNGNNNNNNG